MRLSWRLEWSVYFIATLVFLSGVVWAWLQWSRPNDAAFGFAAHPWEIWMQRLHGAAAMLVLLLVGRLLASHIPGAWQARRNRRTGSLLFALLGFLIATGYLLYYAGDDRIRLWVSRSHLWLGLAFPLSLAIHVFRGKRSRKWAAAQTGET